MKNLIAFPLLLLLYGCATSNIPNTPQHTDEFKAVEKNDKTVYFDAQALAEFEAEADPVYRMGAGDKLTLTVWNRPNLSGKHTVGPDGQITIPFVGHLPVTAMTAEEAESAVASKLKQYYKRPVVYIAIDDYQANSVTVLGRVLTPGVLRFDKPPVLLDVLARAGSLPVLDKQATLTRCAVFRGREKIIWVDLKQLLNRGNLAYNIRLKPNDLVYIPDSLDTSVYVLGAVEKPGAYHLTPDMSLMDALAQAGGPNEDANQDEISLYRPGEEAADRMSLESLVLADRKVNYTLEEGDVIYVPKKGVAEIGYVMRQLLPGLSFMSFGLAASAIGGN